MNVHPPIIHLHLALKLVQFQTHQVEHRLHVRPPDHLEDGQPMPIFVTFVFIEPVSPLNIRVINHIRTNKHEKV